MVRVGTTVRPAGRTAKARKGLATGDRPRDRSGTDPRTDPGTDDVIADVRMRRRHVPPRVPLGFPPRCRMAGEVSVQHQATLPGRPPTMTMPATGRPATAAQAKPQRHPLAHIPGE